MKTEELEKLLRERGLRVTPKRIALLTLIVNNKAAITRSYIQKELKNFDRVTLYRTLNTLMEGGIIHVAHVSSDDVYYAVCKHSCTSHKHTHNHIHFKCDSCNEITCVEPQKEISLEVLNLKINQINVQASGLCNKCI